MDKIVRRLKAYIDTNPFDLGDSDCETVLDQLYQAYVESHESDPVDISEGFKELEEFLCTLPLEDNNAVFDLCCRLCSAYESLRELLSALRWLSLSQVLCMGSKSINGNKIPTGRSQRSYTI